METPEDVCNKKTKYASAKLANEDVERIRKKSTRPVVPSRAYYCTICNFWHLTSNISRSDLLKDKLIASLQEQNEELKEKLSEATKELTGLKDANSKGDRVAIRAEVRKDERVKHLTEKSNKLGKLVKKLRDDNSDLIAKNLSLERKLNQKNESENK